jgi:allantoinase
VLLFHAELEDPSGPVYPDPSSNPTAYETFLSSRPEDLEMNAISLITRLQEQYPSLRCHIVHLSASSALGVIRAARRKGLKLTVETCFHYLCLSADNIPNGRPEFKCCPPIRDESNRNHLWKALMDGDIDCVVSDHSPCVAELKKLDEGDIMGAWGGINSLGLGLSLLWTEGSKPERGATLSQVVEWMSKKTAEHAGLSATKGSLTVGLDGDLVIWDPEAEYKARTRLSAPPPLFDSVVNRFQRSISTSRISYPLTRDLLLKVLCNKLFCVAASSTIRTRTALTG